jgi:hypothetical protein
MLVAWQIKNRVLGDREQVNCQSQSQRTYCACSIAFVMPVM